MPPDIEKEHAIETYKSLIQISVQGLKLLAVLNGGATVALLAYLGNVAGKRMPVPDMRLPMACYVVGLAFCGFAFVASYLTQLVLYNETVGNPVPRWLGRHSRWLWAAIVLVVLSLSAFSIGSIVAAYRFR